MYHGPINCPFSHTMNECRAISSISRRGGGAEGKQVLTCEGYRTNAFDTNHGPWSATAMHRGHVGCHKPPSLSHQATLQYFAERDGGRGRTNHRSATHRGGGMHYGPIHRTVSHTMNERRALCSTSRRWGGQRASASSTRTSRGRGFWRGGGHSSTSRRRLLPRTRRRYMALPWDKIHTYDSWFKLVVPPYEMVFLHLQEAFRVQDASQESVLEV